MNWNEGFGGDMGSEALSLCTLFGLKIKDLVVARLEKVCSS